MAHRWWMVVGVAIVLLGPACAGSVASGTRPHLKGPDALGESGTTVAVSEADSFLGTWVIAMTVPKGAQETIRVWDNAGRVAASAQAQQFPPIMASDIAKMGKSLVLNVRPIQKWPTHSGDHYPRP
jgi:hypothetical protein